MKRQWTVAAQLLLGASICAGADPSAPGAAEFRAMALPVGFVCGETAVEATAVARGEAAPPLAFPNHPGWPVAVRGCASPPVCADIDPAYPGLEILVGTLSSAVNLYAFHEDGTPVSGFPVDIGFFVAASPAIGDINGDGGPEIVACDFGSNQVWALRTDGTPLPGWPIPVGANVRSTAALADLDPAVPGLEVIVGVQDGTLQAWHADASSVAGWPVTAGNFVERCSPAVGDVDGDGDLEVFVGSWYNYAPGSTGGVYGFDHTGAPLPGWPRLTDHISVIASPALADLDGDGDKEIIVGTHETNSKMHVWHHDGTEMAGWPFTIPHGAASVSYISSSPAVGDIDGDGELEIVDGSCGDCGTVYAWRRDGTVLPGWPFATNTVVDGVYPVLGDVDGDGRIDIVVGSGSGLIPNGCDPAAISQAYILRDDGSVMPGWPVDLGTATPPNPALADVDGDGAVEVVLAFAELVYLWDAPGPYVTERIPWAYYHFGIDHTGDFAAPGPPAGTIHVPGEQPTIQAGIDAANDGNTVLVADGIYTGPGNRELDFHGKAITVRSAAGDPELCIIDCGDADPYTGFYFHSGEDSTSVLAGFTIKNGVATHCEGSLDRYVGGGIFCDAGSAPVLRNLILRENSAGFGGAGLGLYMSGAIVRDCHIVENGNGGAYVDGGAIFAGCQIEQNAGVGLDLRYSDAQILGCTVSGNEFHVLGGILIEVRDCSIAAYMYGHEGSIGFYDCSFSGDLHYFYESSLWFYNCSFLACPSGALLFWDAWFAMEDCLLADNSAANGGAIRVAGDCSGRIERTRFANNVATGGGGAIFADCPNELELTDCEFLGNVAGGGGGGGAIGFISWLAGPVLSLTRCTLAGNSALGGSPGGAIAGIMDSGDSVQLVDCLLTGNYSEGDGGALCLTREPYYTSQLFVAGSTFSGNRCQGTGGGIAGVELTSAELCNSILWGNCAGAAGDQLSMSGAGATVDFTCCVVDSAGVAAGTAAYDAGTYFGDPRFCSLLPCGEAPFMEFAGFTVEAGSPCLPEHNDCGVLIGALGQGCTQVAAPDQPVAVRPLLAQNHPNPFNARTSIVFSLPQAGPAGLRIYDPAGRVRRVLLAGVHLAAGPHRLDWDGRDGEGEALPSGVYLCRLQTPWGNIARKMTLLQ